MSRLSRFIAASLVLWALTAPAVETPLYNVPYVGANAGGLSPDSARNSSVAGGGYHAFGGWPLKSGHSAVEVRLLDYQMHRNIDGSSNYQTSLFTDYVYDFGSSIQGAGGFFRGTKFFLNAGLGFVQEDSYGKKGNYLAVDAGGGLLVPLGFKGWAVRIDGRAQLENNGDLCDSAAVAAGKCTKEKSTLLDYVFGAGLQIPLTIFFDRPVAVAQQEDCPIAVVDPATGRRDCGARGSDADGDGVPDLGDKCPGTASAFKVDAQGCAIAQGFDLAAAALFSGNSATLTPDGKRTLAEIGRMIAAQASCAATVQAEGGSGSAAFNQVLNEQRVTAVRQALMEDGVKPGQLPEDPAAADTHGQFVLTLMVQP